MPPGVSAVPVAASVMRAYCRSIRGKAMTGSEVSCCCRILKDCKAAGGKGPDLYPESFLVTWNSGAAIIAKSFMCVLKKLQSPTKDLTILIVVGGLASLIA